MSAYIIVKIQVSDPSKLKNYQEVAPAIIEKYNGKFIARGGEVVSLEGPDEQRKVVIIEFPSLDDAKKFYGSDEYTKAIKLRIGVSECEMIAVDGI